MLLIKSSKEDLNDSIRDILDDLKNKIQSKKEQLEALNPSKILERGYSITMNENGEVINDITKVNKGDKVTTVVAKGKIISTVDDVEVK